jgi:hypothetical protein
MSARTSCSGCEARKGFRRLNAAVAGRRGAAAAEGEAIIEDRASWEAAMAATGLVRPTGGQEGADGAVGAVSGGRWRRRVQALASRVEVCAERVLLQPPCRR